MDLVTQTRPWRVAGVTSTNRRAVVSSKVPAHEEQGDKPSQFLLPGGVVLLLADAFQCHTNYSRFSHVPSKIFFGTFSFIRNLGQSHMLKCLNFLQNGNANVFSPLQILPVRRKRTAPITGQVSSTCQPTSTEVEVYTSPHKYHHHRDLQCDGGLPGITSNETQNFLKGNTLPQPGWQGPLSHGSYSSWKGFQPTGTLTLQHARHTDTKQGV